MIFVGGYFMEFYDFFLYFCCFFFKRIFDHSGDSRFTGGIGGTIRVTWIESSASPVHIASVLGPSSFIFILDFMILLFLFGFLVF